MCASSRKVPRILNFSENIAETVRKVEEILCTSTSGWQKHLIYDLEADDETKLLFELLFERAIVIGEVYYTPIRDFPEEVRQRARLCLNRLAKREADYVLLNAANHFLKHDVDLEKSDKMTVFYPSINAYVRCGGLEPARLFEYLEKDDCERVIIFGGFSTNDSIDNTTAANETAEVFYSFEMNAPKKYILGKLQELRDRRFHQIADILRKTDETNNVFPKNLSQS